MTHKLKMFLLSSFSIAKKKMKHSEDMPLVELQEAKTTFQSTEIMDARNLGIIHLASKGFHFNRKILWMNNWEFLEYLKTK